MKGNNLGKRYFLESANIGDGIIEMVVFQCFDDGEYIFRCTGKSFAECAKQFEEAKIFDGKTIYEAEQDIEVLYG